MNSDPRHDDLNDDDLDPIPPGKALAIGVLPVGAPQVVWGPVGTRGRAVNFNPNHDERGRFACDDHEGGSGSSGGSDAGSDDEKNKYKVLHPITASAFAQKTLTSECAPAVALEIVAHVAKLRTDADEKAPEESIATMRTMENHINRHRAKIGRPPVDFTGYQRGKGAGIDDMIAVLEEHFAMTSQPLIHTDQIPENLQHGPILVGVGPKDNAHAEEIVGIAGPHSYFVYNPLKTTKSAGIIDASDITIAEDGNPVLFAMSPRKKGKAK